MTTFIDYYLENHMDNITLFEKILLRVAKEKKYMNHINKKYNRNKLLNYINSINIGYTIKTSYILYDNNIARNVDLSLKVNTVIYELLKKEFINFLNKNNILDKFTHNLATERISTSFSRGYNTLNQYLTHLNYCGISPFNVITEAFLWQESEQKYRFWKKIDSLYKIYLLNLLFNANINEEKANYF